MIARFFRGLRGRLLLALVATSATTLVVAAAVTLSPLQQRLREQSTANLRTAMGDEAFALGIALDRSPEGRRAALDTTGFELYSRTGGRVIVTGTDWTHPLYDSSTGSPLGRNALLANFSAWRLQRTVEQREGDGVTLAMPLYGRDGLNGVVVLQRNLTEVTTAVEQVRNALLAAAGIGLAVAVALAIALSTTLLRRLGRLRAAALRISAEGTQAPTPRDQGRDEVGDLARALARMQEDLRRQEAARRSFVATASHELRTPLTMLQGTMELLEEDLRDGADLRDAHEQVASARHELRRLAALAGELLDLSRLDAEVQLRSEPVELGEVARAVVAEFALRAAERGVEIDAEPPPRACWGRGDPDAVARVIRILLDNALHYGPPGTPIEVVTSCAGRSASVEVRDAGRGVPADERERIFERFHRGRDSSTQSGFGLGLAIGRELATRMSGTLELAEPDGPGARFRLTLTAARPSSPAPSPAPDSAAAA